MNPLYSLLELYHFHCGNRWRSEKSEHETPQNVNAQFPQKKQNMLNKYFFHFLHRTFILNAYLSFLNAHVSEIEFLHSMFPLFYIIGIFPAVLTLLALIKYGSGIPSIFSRLFLSPLITISFSYFFFFCITPFVWAQALLDNALSDAHGVHVKNHHNAWSTSYRIQLESITSSRWSIVLRPDKSTLLQSCRTSFWFPSGQYQRMLCCMKMRRHGVKMKEEVSHMKTLQTRLWEIHQSIMAPTHCQMSTFGYFQIN